MATCGKCKRSLSDPESIKRGFGPLCWAKVMAGEKQEEAERRAAQLPFEGDVVLLQRGNGQILTNVPHDLVRHSPTGFAWGYGGSGPADLALNILLLYTDQETADRLYQRFKWYFIATMDPWGGVIKGDDIRNWLQEQRGVQS